ncbi:hypothetical protein Sgou_13080 [Streptomyces gougerotii]|uniref:Uncharacterized protein n=1 Tax=Streptomyces gougerotii TaxID=53448 RepID=A0A8H9LW60_9ACTN|nr:hypothetical protein Srut_43800 [Streptomyces rutgersensis]GFH76638.1 hypothetical protein Sgou_13080 [Streptomyces gougerotii]GGU88329.1 hypothetical protein GCM10010227_48920 [Streptomyces gougerotii]
MRGPGEARFRPLRRARPHTGRDHVAEALAGGLREGVAAGHRAEVTVRRRRNGEGGAARRDHAVPGDGTRGRGPAVLGAERLRPPRRSLAEHKPPSAGAPSRPPGGPDTRWRN